MNVSFISVIIHTQYPSSCTQDSLILFTASEVCCANLCTCHERFKKMHSKMHSLRKLTWPTCIPYSVEKTPKPWIWICLNNYCKSKINIMRNWLVFNKLRMTVFVKTIQGREIFLFVLFIYKQKTVQKYIHAAILLVWLKQRGAEIQRNHNKL